MESTARPSSSRLAVPTRARANEVMTDARRVFLRTLTGWASDTLTARHLGLARCAWRQGHADHRFSRAA
ncbi:MAG: hypothetical protein ACYTG1_00740 [Planctomycetota bacterium]|jgi:hypothetical protein